MPSEKPRVTFVLSEEEKDAVDNFRFKHKCKNQSQAVLSLLLRGLEEFEKESNPDDGAVAITDARESLMIELFEKLDDEDKADLYRYGNLLLMQEKYKG